MILQELTLIQERRGWLPEEELHALAERARTPLYRIHEVASFYPHYRLRPPPAVDVKVCRDLACHLRGAAGLRPSLAEAARDYGDKVCVGGASCLGQCDRAPAVAINHHVYRGLSEAEYVTLVRAAAEGKPLAPQHADTSLPTWRIDPYQGGQTYKAVRRYLGQGGPPLTADAVLAELKTADLRGMG